jgi:hypothetical protein
MSSTPDQDSALIIAYQHHKLEQKKSLAQVAGLQQQILNRGCAGSSPDMMRGLQKDLKDAMAKQAQHKASLRRSIGKFWTTLAVVVAPIRSKAWAG